MVDEMHSLICSTLLILSGIFSVPLMAQRSNQEVPSSSIVKVGELSNGLKYYVCRSPRDSRGHFYMIQRSGSLVEEKGEYGYAHFVEHLVFKETKSFKNGEIVDFTRRHGGTFGKNLNAATGYGFTFYTIKDLQVREESVVDTCMSVLREMMYDAVISNQSVEAERNVILEEMLLRGSNDIYFDATPFERPIIGNRESILASNGNSVRRFYNKWYQPQMQAIVVITPYDAEQTVSKIKRVFGDIKRGNAVAPQKVLMPQADTPRMLIKKDGQNAGKLTMFKIKIRQPHSSANQRRSVGDYLERACASKLFMLLNALFRENMPGISCRMELNTDIDYVPMIKFRAETDSKSWNELVLKTINMLESIKIHGFPTNLLERYNISDRIESNSIDSVAWVKNKLDIVDNCDAVFVNCMENFLYGTNIVDDYIERQIYDYFDRSVDGKEIHAMFCRFYSAAMPTYILTSTDTEQITAHELEDVINKAKHEETRPLSYRDVRDDGSKNQSMNISVQNLTGKVVSDRCNKETGVRELLLSNGVKVVINRSKTMGNVYLDAFREGGRTLVDADEGFRFVLMQDFSMKKDSFNYRHYMNESNDEYSMIFSEDELEKAFCYFYKKLTDVYLDSVCLYKRWKANYELSTSGIGKLILNSRIPYKRRVFEMNDSVMSSSELNEIRSLCKKYKSNYNGMVVAIECSKNEEEIISFVEKYIGSLPYKNEPSAMRDPEWMYFYPKDSTVVDTVKGSKMEQVYISFYQDRDLKYTPETYIQHLAVVDILTDVIIDKVRLQNGDVYSPVVKGDMSQFPHASRQYDISFSCALGKSDKIITDIINIVRAMAYGDGITVEMTDRFSTSMKREGGYRNLSGAKAYRVMQKIKFHGVVIDSNRMELNKIVTPEKLKLYLRKLFEKGNIYKYIMIGEKGNVQ